MTEINDTNIVDDGHWTEGDLTIISSDNVRFRIVSHHVLAASKVFADADKLSCPKHDTVVHLTDPTIKTAEVIKLFLEVVHSWKCPSGRPDIYLAVGRTKFLQKYDCPRPLELVPIWVQRYLDAERFDCGYVLACVLKDEALTSRAVERIVLGSRSTKRNDRGEYVDEFQSDYYQMVSAKEQWALFYTTVQVLRRRNHKESVDGRIVRALFSSGLSNYKAPMAL